MSGDAVLDMANVFDFCKWRSIEDSLLWYQQGGFARLNAFLWQRDLNSDNVNRKFLQDMTLLKGVAKDAINLSSIIGTSPSELTLFRGDNDSHFDMSEFKKGATISFKGFSSTSSSINVAKNFATTDSPNTTSIIFDIKVPKGGKFLAIQNAEFSYEKETLLPPCNYEVLDVSRTQNGSYYIVMEQKEMLDIHTLIDEGLDNVKSSINSPFAWHKKIQISRLKDDVSRYIEYQSKNPSITILPNMAAPNLPQNNFSNVEQEIMSDNYPEVLQSQNTQSQNLQDFEDGMGM